MSVFLAFCMPFLPASLSLFRSGLPVCLFVCLLAWVRGTQSLSGTDGRKSISISCSQRDFFKNTSSPFFLYSLSFLSIHSVLSSFLFRRAPATILSAIDSSPFSSPYCMRYSEFLKEKKRQVSDRKKEQTKNSRNSTYFGSVI